MQSFKAISRCVAALVLLAGVSAQANAPAIVEQVKSFREGDVFTAELQLKGEVTVPEVAVQFNNESFQVDLPQAALAKNKQLIRLEDRMVKSVYVHQPDSGMVRAKIALRPGFLAKSLDERVRVRRKSGSIAIEVVGEAASGTAAKGEPELARLVTVLDENAAEDPSGLSAKLVVGGEKPTQAGAQATDSAATGDGALASAADAAGAAAEEQKKLDTQKLPESQIPVLATVKEEKKEAGGQLHRILITLGVLATLFGAASFGLKRWVGRSGKKNQKSRIKVLTQHHLGTKKSLAIIQVAGESLLIGITDQNISMLKTLSLLDEEIPEAVPQNFNGAMSDFVEDEDEIDESRAARGRKGRDRDVPEDFAMRGLSEIRDIVSTRLRGMKNLE